MVSAHSEARLMFELRAFFNIQEVQRRSLFFGAKRAIDSRIGNV